MTDESLQLRQEAPLTATAVPIPLDYYRDQAWEAEPACPLLGEALIVIVVLFWWAPLMAMSLVEGLR